nr:hypothetical protein [uncultured Roseibium sp.]
MSFVETYPACPDLMGVRVWSQYRLVIFGNAAGENEIELVLIFSCGLFAPMNFRNMHQVRHGDCGTDFFHAFALQAGFKRFARVLLAAGQSEVPAFDGVSLVLHQQPVTPADKGSWC